MQQAGTQRSIRIAARGDAFAVTNLINLAFQVEKFFIDGDRITLAQVESLMSKGEFLLFENEGGLAGCVYVEPRGDRAYLGLLSVDPGLQGSGAGLSQTLHEIICQISDYADPVTIERCSAYL